jgi:hypothetical protein
MLDVLTRSYRLKAEKRSVHHASQIARELAEEVIRAALTERDLDVLDERARRKRAEEVA